MGDGDGSVPSKPLKAPAEPQASEGFCGMENHKLYTIQHVLSMAHIYTYPRSSMYGIFTYIWVIYGVNVGKYTIHG